MQDDPKLVKNILKGNRKAIDELYQRYERQWFRLCLRYSRNRSQGQDIMQEGLIMVFKDLKQFDSERGKFSHWSNRVMVNAALRYLKKHHWQQSFEDLNIIENQQDLSESILGRISAKELTEVIQLLPSGYRMVFNMYEIEGYSHKEIAVALNISVGTSKSQLSKAKKFLRHKIEVLF